MSNANFRAPDCQLCRQKQIPYERISPYIEAVEIIFRIFIDSQHEKNRYRSEIDDVRGKLNYFLRAYSM